MLPVSLDCPFVLPRRYSLAFICPVSCVPYVTSFSRLSFSFPRRHSLAFICPVSCVPYVTSFSRLFFYCPVGILYHLFVLCLVYPMLPVSLTCPIFTEGQ
jgi:hypothetical protein